MPLLCRARLRPLPPVDGCILSLRSRLSLSSRTRAAKCQCRQETPREELTENVVSELRELQAEGLELDLGLGPQSVGARGPEARDRRAHGVVVVAGVGVDVAGVGDLALGRGVDAVDLGAGERLEAGHAELFREGVHARMLEELVARVIDGGDGGVGLEDALARQLFGEVFAGVEEFEKAADSFDVLVGQLDPARLFSLAVSHKHKCAN